MAFVSSQHAVFESTFVINVPMTDQKIRVGISTCPNDTFAFHGLLTGKVDSPGLDLEFELLDVQQLNEKLIAGELQVAKGSFHAGLLESRRVGVLDAGSALGFGVGPLLLSALPSSQPTDRFVDSLGNARAPIVLCPGEHTTAHLLYRLLYVGEAEIEQVVFSEIMPRLQGRTADFGVCIHEGRFTWQQEGLGCVSDLGQMWETKTGMPLPLGGIFAQHDLGDDAHHLLSQTIAMSIDYGWQNRDETLETMRQHAQELTDEVIFAHVDLYVNDWTKSLKREVTVAGESNSSTVRGTSALVALHTQAISAGFISADHPPLQILG